MSFETHGSCQLGMLPRAWVLCPNTERFQFHEVNWGQSGVQEEQSKMGVITIPASQEGGDDSMNNTYIIFNNCA